MPKHTTRSVGLAIACIVMFASTATAGPPWISVEYPANPHDTSTRGALFLVHTFHHGTSVEGPLSASFEGLVDGERRTIAAEVGRTHRTGVFAVRGKLPVDGSWVAVVRMRDGEGAAAALVTLDARGAVLAIDVPADRNREGWYIPRAVEEQDVARALRTAARVASVSSVSAADARSDTGLRLAGVLGLLVVCVGVGVRRVNG
ncbi:MAG: hypothetical protein ACREKM_12790 [Longimicrobiales bacterium]